ncbi:hypothetical protein CHARACLAT_005203 [Characodon lateralis]|uniref:Uncharacterized protein n=1 Tax=Characodon lateralis TaxID=208331 RepID=A0ABU7D7A0_9TELE|nr:hypothetical protein [Characodon lateralis]
MKLSSCTAEDSSLTVEENFKDYYMLCMWENLQNWQCIKYLFSPLYYESQGLAGNVQDYRDLQKSSS